MIISGTWEFSEKKAAIIMEQLLSAINYCHKNNVVHRFFTFFYSLKRDLKPENILISTNSENSLVVKSSF